MRKSKRILKILDDLTTWIIDDSLGVKPASVSMTQIVKEIQILRGYRKK